MKIKSNKLMFFFLYIIDLPSWKKSLWLRKTKTRRWYLNNSKIKLFHSKLSIVITIAVTLNFCFFHCALRLQQGKRLMNNVLPWLSQTATCLSAKFTCYINITLFFQENKNTNAIQDPGWITSCCDSGRGGSRKFCINYLI